MRVLRTLLPCLIFAVSSAPAFAEAQLHLVIPGFSAVGLPESKAAFFSEHLGSALTRAGVRVTTAKAVSEVLGIERQKQLLGCTDTGCTIELTNALGADGIISGEVATLSNSIQCNIRLLSSRSGEVLEALSVRAPNDEALLDELEGAARRLAATGATRLSRELGATAAAKGPSLRTIAIAPAAVGLAGVVTGAVLLFLARAQLDAIPLTGSAISETDAQAHATAGRPLETGGWVAVGAGGAAIAAAVVMFAVGGNSSTVSAAISPLPSGGAWAGVGGSF